MNSRILKYCLFNLRDDRLKFEAEVEMPGSATIKHVELQNSAFGFGVMAWAEVITDDYKRVRKFVLLSTGEEIPDNGTYMTTVTFTSGTVWHLYEIKS